MLTSHPVDVSGRSGGAGADGRSPGGEAGRASDGATGGNGRPGGDGVDAGRIEATLAVVGGTVVLRGVAEADRGSRPAEVAFPLAADDLIALRARGGDGGRGGDAGDGQDGGRGHSGSDATRFSDGDDGGPGGDGGDAGEPADGGAAGRGGAIALSLDEHDMHALMALAIDLGAGRPGAGGRGGRGGAGGVGGPGGSGYSWTESYNDTESYTDSNGNSATRSVTRTTSHHNSGGSRGPTGAAGRPSSRRAAPGAAAPTGSLAITIDHGGRRVTYVGIYDLELVACTFAPVDERLFPGDCFEPGQRVRIASVELRNRGAMPTPVHQDITIEIAAEAGVQPLTSAAIPRAIPPGGQMTLDDPGITCRLGDLRGVTAEPFAGAGAITLVAVVGGIGRHFADTCVRPFVLRSPVVLEEPEIYTSLGPGERTAWSWTVRNQALLPFGAGSPLARALATTIHDPGGDCPAELVVVERDGQALDRTQPFADAIALLAPGTSATLRATFAFAAAAKPFTGRSVAVAFSVGGRDGGAAQALQRRAALVKVAPLYRKSPEAAVLLITNHGTTVAEVDAWVGFLAALGLEADVFDLSHAGSVDLDRAWSATQTLREEWRGRTVVALNNLFTGPAGEQSAADYLFDRQVLGSMLDDDIGWYAPGRGRPLITAEALLSTRRRSRHPLEMWSGHADAPTAVHARIADEEAVLLHVARRRWFHLQIDAGHLEGVARRIIAELSFRDPTRRYVVVHDFVPKRTVRTFWSSTWDLGTISVAPVPGPGTAGAVHLALADGQVHDATVIGGRANRAAFILALPFAEKLRLFCSLVVAGYNFDLVPERRELAMAYADALVADCAVEQEAVRRDARRLRTWRLARLLTTGRRVWCERLRLLCTSGFIASVPAGSERGRILADLIGRLHAVIDAWQPWWACLFPGLRAGEITGQGRALLRALARTAFGQERRLFVMPGEPEGDPRTNLAQAAARIATRRRRRAAASRGGNPTTASTLAALCPGLPIEALSLLRLLGPDEDRVISAARRARASAAQDREDDATRARSTAHENAQRRLVSGTTPEPTASGESRAANSAAPPQTASDH